MFSVAVMGRMLVAVEFLSLDGVMQGLGSYDEDRDGGFEHGGWGVPYGDVIGEVTGGAGSTSAYLFGRRTYDALAAFWPNQPDTVPFAASLNAAPKYVASRTRTTLDWKGSELLAGDLVDAVTTLKGDGTGDLVIIGSGTVVQQLMRARLVDELRLFVHPLLLGTGKRLFADLPDPQTLRLTATGVTSKGTVALTYTVERA